MTAPFFGWGADEALSLFPADVRPATTPGQANWMIGPMAQI